MIARRSTMRRAPERNALDIATMAVGADDDHGHKSVGNVYWTRVGAIVASMAGLTAQ